MKQICLLAPFLFRLVLLQDNKIGKNKSKNNKNKKEKLLGW